MSNHHAKYQNLIRRAAWYKVRQNPNLDFEEVCAEGALAYCEALQTHDPAKGAFSTHLTWQLKYRLGSINSSKIDWDNHTTDLDQAGEIPDPDNPLESSSLRTGLEGLGSEAMEVINLILGSAGELCDFTMSSVKVTRGNIQKYLRSRKWPWRKIDMAIGEIKTMLRGL